MKKPITPPVIEILPIFDKNNKLTGSAPRLLCHSNPNLIHRAVHVLVLDDEGRLLLQKRSKNKDVQPGKWDTSVGGHLMIGEKYLAAAKREMKEEIGLAANIKMRYAYSYQWRNEKETENIKTYVCTHNGPLKHNQYEIDAIKFWTIAEIKKALGKNRLTPNFESEFGFFLKWRSAGKAKKGK